MRLTYFIGAICLEAQISVAWPQLPKIGLVSSESQFGLPKSYGAYQFELFAKGIFGGANAGPLVTTDPNKLEEQAKSKMSAKSFGFLAGGSGERATMDANRLAFRQWKLVPRMLRSSGARDLSVQLFNKTYPTPLLFAPIGFLNAIHADAEAGVAEIAKELEIPYVKSMNSFSPVDDIAFANGDGARWFQLYWPPSDQMTISLLKNAKANGFEALVVTLDATTLGWRPWDQDQAYFPMNIPQTPKHPNNNSVTSLGFGIDALFNKPPSWSRLKFLREHWSGPILLKGIQHVDDAKEAVAAGMDGIIVSNHGGRQLDGGIGSLDALAEITAEVGDRITVLFDSGIRTGPDIIKALSLGAKAVLVGRPWAYGLGIAGKEGAKAVIRGLLADLEISMKIAGLQSVKDCNRGILRKVTYFTDIQSSN